MRIICIHKERLPHRIHYAWIKSITNEFYKLIPDIFYGVKHTKINNTLLLQLLAFFKSFRLPNADIYIADGMISMLPAILHKRKGTKIILINSDTFFYNYKRANPITKLIYGLYLKQVDAIISTSQMLREMAREHTKAPHEVVYPFVNKKFFDVKSDTNSKSIGYFGRLTPEKNIKLMIDIFKKVKPENKDKLVLIGGKYHTREQNVIIKPFSKDVRPDMKKCGLFMMLSRYDSFGASIAEAMGMGMPTIISKYCGAKEIVAKVSNELIIDLNADKIAALIDKLNSNPQIKKKYGEKSRKIAKQLTEEISIANFRKAFNKLARL